MHPPRASLKDKLIETWRTKGPSQTAIKIARYILRVDYIQGMWHRKSLRVDSRKDIFRKIYRHNYWGSSESVSGEGSTEALTVNLRLELPRLFKEFAIRSVYDAPCGDYNWMRLLMSTEKIEYYGADIVPELIHENNNKYKSENIQFNVADVTIDLFPKADLWICRDCLFHLSYADIYSALDNFVKSDIPLILTSTHINLTNFDNRNILTGGFRLIDLFKAPFCFPDAPLYRITDWIPPHAEREMCLWTREQVAEVLPRMRQIALS